MPIEPLNGNIKGGNKMYRQIEFINGSNPYICFTDAEFKRIKEHYVLEKLTDRCYRATDRISYSVIGFSDKDKRAIFSKEYTTKSGALKRIKRMINVGKFQHITLRRNESYLKNSDDLEISSSVRIKTWEM